MRKLQQSEEDFVEKNDKLRKFNSEKYKEVEDSEIQEMSFNKAFSKMILFRVS